MGLLLVVSHYFVSPDYIELDNGDSYTALLLSDGDIAHIQDKIFFVWDSYSYTARTKRRE